MLTEICARLRNWFPAHKMLGTFTIENGALRPQFDNGAEFSAIPIVGGQYFRIIGSALNDGVYQWPATTLQDETFDGAVWTMSIPPAVLKIAENAEEWRRLYGNADSPAVSPYQSESFGSGGYSYGKGASGTNGSSATTWWDIYGHLLAPWRKI